MKTSAYLLCVLMFPMVGNVFGQSEPGFEMGGLDIRPEISVLGAYDDRVNRTDDSVDSDYYSDVEAGIGIANLPSLYDFSASAYYGYRFYNDYTDFDDDYYELRAAAGYSQGPLLWGVSSDYTKALSYNVSYDPDDGQVPDSILTDSENKRWTSQGWIAYEQSLSERTSIRPEYRLLHYRHELQGQDTAEWHEHQVGIQVRRMHTERTTFYSAVRGSFQSEDEEDGITGEVVLGAEGRVGDKVGWNAEAGYAYADYEESGTDHGFSGEVKGTWGLTEKISSYVFGSSDFQPGYSGGAARRVYRLGYGLGWQALEKLSLSAALLHDYQEEIGSNKSDNPAMEEFRTFFTAGADYQFTNHFLAGLGYRYANDEFDDDQQVVSARASYRF